LYETAEFIVVGERTRIGAHIRENLKALGLKRVSRTLALQDYLDQQKGKDDGSNELR
jgi:hypothetical protein